MEIERVFFCGLGLNREIFLAAQGFKFRLIVFLQCLYKVGILIKFYVYMPLKFTKHFWEIIYGNLQCLYIQVHERQTARMRTRSEWFLTPVGERLIGTDSDPTAMHILRGSNRSSSGNIGKLKFSEYGI